MRVVPGGSQARSFLRGATRISCRDLRRLRGAGRRSVCPAERSTRLLQLLFRQGAGRYHHDRGTCHRVIASSKEPAVGVIIIREMVGTSPRSWSDAARQAVATASRTVRNIQTVEVVKSTAVVRDGEIVEYRVEVKIGFEYED